MTTDNSRADALTDDKIIDEIGRAAGYDWPAGYRPQRNENTGYFFTYGELVDLICRLLAASPVEQHEAAPAAQPSERGIYAWIAEGSAALVHVHTRPTDHSPGNVLNGSLIRNCTFYDGCAIEQWSGGTWYGPLKYPAVNMKPEPQPAPSAPLEGTGNGADAWMTEDGRVISDAQKQGALRDGGASASSVRPFSIELCRRAPRTDVSGAVPDGWKLVPIKITAAMIEAGLEGHYGKRRARMSGGAAGIIMTVDGKDWSGADAMRHIWKGALDAAPQPPSADAAAETADERAAFEQWWNDNTTWPVTSKNIALHAWQARAAASQPAAAAGQEAVAIPAGWKFSVTESDGRIWLGIDSPCGAGCALSAAAYIDEGRGSTIAAQILRTLALDLTAPPAQEKDND
ncbi:hypothetical protein [Burkholderia ambifaria]|uniref:hypothetical protein n=1 Tax=Burkholderia ambifaria TaxID=152480 RepID=UPI00158A9695|nr:hypothetical protein [Burkholderia ambifaria]